MRAGKAALLLRPFAEPEEVPNGPSPEDVLSSFAEDGNLLAFEGLYELFDGRLRRLAARILPREEGGLGEVADVVQETWLKVVRHARRWDGSPHPGSAYSWISRILLNLCCDRLRKRGPDRALLDEGPLLEQGAEAASTAGWMAGLPVPSDVIIRASIERCLNLLTPAQRLHLVLVAEGYSNTAIAEATGRKPSAVNALVWKAREALETLLSERGISVPREDADR